MYLQLLLEQSDLSDARFSGLIGLFYLPPLSSQTKPDILQFTLQLGLLIILETRTKRWKESVYTCRLSSLSSSVLSQTTRFSLPDKDVYTTFDYQGLQFKFQGLLSGFEHHDALLLSVPLSQKLLATLTLPFQLTLTLQLTLSSLDIQMAVLHD